MTVRVRKYYRRGRLEGFIIEKNGNGLLIALDEAEEFLRQLKRAVNYLESLERVRT